MFAFFLFELILSCKVDPILELVKNMKDVINRLNKIEEENLELKSNISQRMSLIESNIDVILRNNGKGTSSFS